MLINSASKILIPLLSLSVNIIPSASLILALSQGWKLALVMTVLFTPAMFLRMFILVQLQAHFSKKKVQEYASANLVSQEALNGIQTVQAYNAIDYEYSKYTGKLERVLKFGLKKSFIEGNKYV